jgi:ADP-heptose:LPS heptosyltransferase
VGWRRAIFEAFVGSVQSFSRNVKEIPASPKKIFVLRNNDIGDLIVVTPLFDALRRNFPQAEILAGIGSWNREVLIGNPHVSRIVEVNAPWHNKVVQPQGVTSALRYIYRSPEAQRLRKEEPDVGIDVLGSGFGSLLFMRVQIPYRIGVHGYAGGDSAVQRFVEHSSDEHVGRQALRQAELLGCTDLPENRPQLFLERTPERHQALVIAPGAAIPEKGWPAQHFVKLARLLKGEQIIAIGSGDDRALGAQIFEQNPDVRDLTGKLSLRETFAVIAGARLLICNSSMAMHAAAAFRRPTLVVLGEQFSAASQHHRQWGYPETTVLGRDKGHPDIFSPEEVSETVREVLSDG